MLDLDGLLNDSKPPGVSEDSASGRAARVLSRQVVRQASVRRLPVRWKWVFGISAAFVLGGTTTALASPSFLGLVPWNAAVKEQNVATEPDLIHERIFPGEGDIPGASCVITLTAHPDALTAGPKPMERLDDAKRFLREFDLAALDRDSDDRWVKERARSTASGDHRPTRHASLLAAQIQSEFESAGFLGDGVSLEVGYGCGDGAAQ